MFLRNVGICLQVHTAYNPEDQQRHLHLRENLTSDLRMPMRDFDLNEVDPMFIQRTEILEVEMESKQQSAWYPLQNMPLLW
jgi:hypothetical protein